MKKVAAVAIAASLMTGCARQIYVRQPAVPAQTATTLEQRSFEDDGFHRFLESALGNTVAWPPKRLDFKTLALAAFYFNPDLAVARANIEVAQAGIVTAQMRPNPVLDFSPGVPSPFLIGVGLAIPVITAGKRRYAVQTAASIKSEAELQVVELAWRVRTQVRSAFLTYLAAERDLGLANSAQSLQEVRLNRTTDELKAGEIARPQWESERSIFLASQLNVRTAESRVNSGRATLASAIGVPSIALSGYEMVWPAIDHVPTLSDLREDQIQRDAIINRLDVRRAVANYQVAEERLRLEIARQHPNFDIGPGYQYEEGHSFFAPSLTISLPIFNRNEGPIAQAEAQRKAAAAQLISVQAAVMAECQQALAQYVADYKLSQAAEAISRNLQHTQTPLVQRTVEAGETDWFALNSMQIQSLAAERTWIGSIFQAQASLGQLENAVQRPLEPGDDTPIVFPK